MIVLRPPEAPATVASMQPLAACELPGDPSAIIRPATPAEAPALYRLITANLESGHLLPRRLEELVAHAPRFLVAVKNDEIVGCAELLPLSGDVAEVRSLVVDEPHRGGGLGSLIVRALTQCARLERFRTLCAFTHDPVPFVRLGFSIVPHVWLPEKIATDCHACVWFRRCGQYAMMLALEHGGNGRHAARG